MVNFSKEYFKVDGPEYCGKIFDLIIFSQTQRKSECIRLVKLF